MAAINRYDTPSRSNYFNTFIPLPLDQITGLGMQRQEDLTRKQEAMGKALDQYALVDYITNSKDQEWVQNEYLPKLQKLAEQGMTTDLSNPVEYAKYATQLRGVGTSEKIRKIEESKARWTQAQAVKQQLIAAGKYNQLLDEDPYIGWDTEAKGIYNYMPEAYEDKASLFEPYYKHLDLRDKGISTQNGYVVQRSAIDERDIKEISDRAAQELASTPQGLQQIRLFEKMYPEMAANMYSEGKTGTDILRMQMEDYGQEYKRSRVNVLGRAQGAGSGEDAPNPYDLTAILTGGKGIEFDPAGAIKEIETMAGGNGNMLSNVSPGSAAMFGPGDVATEEYYKSVYGGGTNKDKNEAKERAYNKIVKMYPIMSKGPNGEDLTKEQVVDNYKTAMDNWKTTSSTVYSFGNEQVNNEWNGRVGNTLQYRKIIIPGKDEPVSVKEAAEYYGYTLGEFSKALINPNDPNVKVNAPSINAKKSGYSSIQILPKNKKSTAGVDILISNTQDENPYYKTYYDLQNTLMSNKNNPVLLRDFSDNSGRKIIAVPNRQMGYDENGNPTLRPSFSEVLIDGNGKMIQELGRNIPLDYYYRQATEAMTKNLHLDKDTKELELEEQSFLY